MSHHIQEGGSGYGGEITAVECDVCDDLLDITEYAVELCLYLAGLEYVIREVGHLAGRRPSVRAHDGEEVGLLPRLTGAVPVVEAKLTSRRLLLRQRDRDRHRRIEDRPVRLQDDPAAESGRIAGGRQSRQRGQRADGHGLPVDRGIGWDYRVGTTIVCDRCPESGLYAVAGRHRRCPPLSIIPCFTGTARCEKQGHEAGCDETHRPYMIHAARGYRPNLRLGPASPPNKELGPGAEEPSCVRGYLRGCLDHRH